MRRFLLVCLAGAIGTGTRYLLGLMCARGLGTAFAYGTLAANVSGCFLMALTAHAALRMAGFPDDLRCALTVGFLGGLTTYSSFNQETTAMLYGGARALALLNFGLTTLGCFVAGLLGFALAREFFGP